MGCNYLPPTNNDRKCNCGLNTTQRQYTFASVLVTPSTFLDLLIPWVPWIEYITKYPYPPRKSQGVTKTYSSKYVIDTVGAMENIIKASKSMNIWASKGDMWNYCYVSCQSILVVYSSRIVIKHAFIRKVFLFLVFPSLSLDYWTWIRIYECIWIACIIWFKSVEITQKVIWRVESCQIHTRHFRSSKKYCFSWWYVNL